MSGGKCYRLTVVGLLTLSLMGGACAATRTGKLAQVGAVLVALSQTTRQACVESKAAGWHPLSEDICRKAAVAYLAADQAWDLADKALRQDPKASVATLLADVISYVLQVTEWLDMAGVSIPPDVLAYTRAIREGLK